LIRNEGISMRAFSPRNALATKMFVEEVLKYCYGRPTFVVSGASWLRGSWRSLGLNIT
jgi:transposase-like protein